MMAASCNDECASVLLANGADVHAVDQVKCVSIIWLSVIIDLPHTLTCGVE